MVLTTRNSRKLGVGFFYGDLKKTEPRTNMHKFSSASYSSRASCSRRPRRVYEQNPRTNGQDLGSSTLKLVFIIEALFCEYPALFVAIGCLSFESVKQLFMLFRYSRASQKELANMEMYMFRREEYDRLYNCTFYNVSMVPLEQRQHTGMGAFFICIMLFFEVRVRPNVVPTKREIQIFSWNKAVNHRFLSYLFSKA